MTSNGTNANLYTILISPNIRTLVPDNTTNTTSDQAGEYLVDAGLLIQHATGIDVTKFTFTDMLLQCLPAPSTQELIDQNITYYANETAPGVWNNGTTR